MTRKTIPGILLAVVLCLLAAGACADHNTDPGFSRMRDFKREEQRYLRKIKQTEETEGKQAYLAYGDVSITISGTMKPAETLTFTASVDGVQDPGNYEFKWGITDEGRDAGGYLYYPQYEDCIGKKQIEYTFYSAGDYSCFVSVYNQNGEWVGSGYEDVTIGDDGVHPTLEQKAAEVVNACRGATEWDTALNLYDWLTHHTYYDATYEHHGADILFLGYGVCDSYSKAYELLCETAGIPADRAFGDDHAWNTLKLGGKWYQADATWDDSGSAMPGEGTPESGWEDHVFFCVNAQAMMRIENHYYASNGTQGGEYAAECTSMDANYYIHTGKWQQFGFRIWDEEIWAHKFVRLTDLIREAFENGNSIYEDDLYGLYMEEDYCNIGYPSILQAILEAGYDTMSFNYQGYRIKVKARVNDERKLRVGLKGWDIQETGTLVIPDQTARIEEEAFTGTAATTVQVPEGCKAIGAGAFASSAVRKVAVPTTVDEIAEDAFSACEPIIFETSNSMAIDYAARHGFLVAEP